MRRDGADFFAERLVIPIRDERSQPLAFTARTVRADEQRKYINSPETPAYVKGRVIFGLDLARDEITKRGHAVMMEGQFDVITAHQFGVANAVASSGTALTEDQVRLLKRFTDELLLVFDADRAGRAAADKASKLAAFHDMRVRVATIPDGNDPDEFLRGAGPQAAERWEALVAAAAPSLEFGMEARVEGLNLSNANHVEVAAARIRELILEYPEHLWEPYRERAERWLGVPFQLRGARGNGPVRPQAAKAAQSNGFDVRTVGKKLTVGRYLLQLLAVNPAAFERIRTKITPDELDEEDRGMYVRMLETFDRGGASGLERELGEYPAEEQDLIRRAWAAPPPNVDDQLAEELVARIRLDRMKVRHSGIIRELSEAERGREADRVARLEAEASELARAINDMERSR
jgi:DNA primase